MTQLIRKAAIDIGTNSTKMTIADVDSSGSIHVVSEAAETTRLGEGVDSSGALKQEAIERTVKAVVRFAAQARSSGAQQVIGAGTSALRDAQNGQSVIDLLREHSGVEVEIITGDREAELAYAAVRSDNSLDLDAALPLLVFDIGGGSTELILGDRTGVQRHHSLNIGAVRLTERFIRTDPPTLYELQQVARYAADLLATFPSPETIPAAAGIGGTVVNVASVIAGPGHNKKTAVHGVTIRHADVATVLTRFQQATLAERRLIPGLEPDRADVITAGVVILDQLLTHFGVGQFTISVRGLRFGLISTSSPIA